MQNSKNKKVSIKGRKFIGCHVMRVCNDAFSQKSFGVDLDGNFLNRALHLIIGPARADEITPAFVKNSELEERQFYRDTFHLPDDRRFSGYDSNYHKNRFEANGIY